MVTGPASRTPSPLAACSCREGTTLLDVSSMAHCRDEGLQVRLKPRDSNPGPSNSELQGFTLRLFYNGSLPFVPLTSESLVREGEGEVQLSLSGFSPTLSPTFWSPDLC